MFIVKSASPTQTVEIGQLLAKSLLPGDLVNLNGTLGAGKTLLVKGIGQGLGIDPSIVTSPTFAIINEYEGTTFPLYHFDLYRLENDLDLEQVGFEEYFFGAGITVVEWGDLFQHYLPDNRLDITLESLGPQERQLLVVGEGERGRELVEQLRGLFPCTF
ncbi:MAG TPA: tRNA (adenosine(37)-N6)-threonylcarbamoyltransferase complex ATPase subunit type 1 TsaE [Limnochordia bacterium]|nr:tRNA (adenosine(37)-N6)-threonylcarbamoyltransferase complex ATPase subunit type 1 TsaE [Limnochordia bacterium]